MRGWLGGAILLWAAVHAQLDVDCARPRQARSLVGRLMLAEIEGAEDIHRAAMWDAFGRCATGSAGERCRAGARRRFEKLWDHQKGQIEAKYRKMLSDFEERCRASIT